jgi:putative serine protease PepD
MDTHDSYGTPEEYPGASEPATPQPETPPASAPYGGPQGGPPHAAPPQGPYPGPSEPGPSQPGTSQPGGAQAGTQPEMPPPGAQAGASQPGMTPPGGSQAGGAQPGATTHYGPYPGGPYMTGPQTELPLGQPGLQATEPRPTWWTPRRKIAAAGAAVVLALGSGVAGASLVAAFGGTHTTLASPTVVQPASAKSASNIAAIAQAVQPSVVSITVTTQQGSDEGSGIILRSDGTILTNNHVVTDAAQGGGSINVKFSNGKSTSATIVGTDPVTDLAVIKAAGVSGLKPVTLGNSDQLQVGDSVVAIGSPLGLDGTVTSGIVSALHRTLDESSDQQQQQQPGLGQEQQQPQQQQQSGATIGDAIQTDAAINPGNSGGPLVNSAGQVIGINSAIATGSGSDGNIGVGFAIPINTAKQVADQLMTTGKATHAFLGVTLTDATGSQQGGQQQTGQQGALLTSVQANTPASKAGLKEGDLITKVNGTAVDGADTLSAAIREHKPGDQITLTYVRGGQTSTVTVSLASSSTS